MRHGGLSFSAVVGLDWRQGGCAWPPPCNLTRPCDALRNVAWQPNTEIPYSGWYSGWSGPLPRFTTPERLQLSTPHSGSRQRHSFRVNLGIHCADTWEPWSLSGKENNPGLPLIRSTVSSCHSLSAAVDRSPRGVSSSRRRSKNLYALLARRSLRITYRTTRILELEVRAARESV